MKERRQQTEYSFKFNYKTPRLERLTDHNQFKQTSVYDDDVGPIDNPQAKHNERGVFWDILPEKKKQGLFWFSGCT